MCHLRKDCCCRSERIFTCPCFFDLLVISKFAPDRSQEKTFQNFTVTKEVIFL